MSETSLTKEQQALRELYGVKRKRKPGTSSSNVYINLDKYLINEWDGRSIVALAKAIKVDRITLTNEAKKLGLVKSYKYTPQPGERFINLDYPLANYAVSNLGNVIDTRNNRLKKAKHNKWGYLVYQFEIQGKPIYRLEHRLIATKFIGNPQNKAEVNHINGITDDNRISNLEWVTHEENMRHAHDILKVTTLGESCSFAKIKKEQAVQIIELLNQGYSRKHIVALLPFATPGNVYGIHKQGNWKELNHLKKWLN